jgi:hypothetical protein
MRARGTRRPAMARGAHAVLVGILLVTASSSAWAARHEVSTTGAAHSAERRVPTIAWSVDFADYAGGSVEAWLHTKGFRLEHGAEDPAALALSHHAGALVVEAKQPVRGFVVNDQVRLAAFSTIRITWGVLKYPKDTPRILLANPVREKTGLPCWWAVDRAE